MGEKIALGFHTCVDFELVWSTEVMEDMIREYQVKQDEISTEIPLESERALLLVCLGHMMKGIGGELIPATPEICLDFANRFAYSLTIGGTATRAAIAISKIGYDSTIQMCCFNPHIRRMLPKGIHYFASVEERTDAVYPHVILQYQAGVRIAAGDVDFVTPRENRVMFSHDIDSMNMEISQAYAPLIQDAEVFLLSCFSEILDVEILKDRMEKTRRLLDTLPEKAIVVMEDGCYIRKDFRYYAHRALNGVVDVLSMNEDELQEYVEDPIDLLDPQSVLAAVEHVRRQSGISTVLVHSAAWALAYGTRAGEMKHALEGGITMAATRFWKGDAFGREEYGKTRELPDKREGILFCDEVLRLTGDQVCCQPCKDMSFVENPTVVGLGDFFAGGMLTELTKDRRRPV